MSFSATRLTCYALIAAIEGDMRASIEGCIGEVGTTDLLPRHQEDRAQNRRIRDGKSRAKQIPGLLPYLDFGESFELLMRLKRDLSPTLVRSLTDIDTHIKIVIATRNRVAHTRPMEIDDSSNLLDLALALIAAAPDHWPTVVDAMARLRADPSYVLGLTVQLPADPATGPQHNLPVPDFDETGFFGRQAQLRRIKRAIKGAYPVVSVLGDGGIGKTSIALRAAYDLLEDPEQPFDAIVWVTAKATILTNNEIQRISGAIETSLGLFAHAAGELGGSQARNDPVSEVLAYMETFRVLLILDNLETVLDTRLRDFLLDLPMGSKVLVTSRIGLGIENPVQLEPLTMDESIHLLRTLARVRNVTQLSNLPKQVIEHLAKSMDGHPAFVRWFVAGVQSGRRPEELLSNNELLLDFCMSNVYEFLSSDARSVVQAMQALPGMRNQAELAFLNDFSAARIQGSLLELLTTNFVQMSSQASAQSLDTVYQLSDFGRQYLEKHHRVEQSAREDLIEKSNELRELGSQLTAASASSPFAAETVNVRSAGDVHVARLLRLALRQASKDSGTALGQCQEAQILAPSYYEAWRVEGAVRAAMRDYAGAIVAYERALELAPESAVVHYRFGTFLLNEAGDPRRALHVLQAGARIDNSRPEITGQIAWAHHVMKDYAQAIDACVHLLTLRDRSANDAVAAAIVGLRSSCSGIGGRLRSGRYDQAGEMLDTVVDFIESLDPRLIVDEALDRLVMIESQARELVAGASEYIAIKAGQHGDRLRTLQRQSNPTLLRRLGVVKSIVAEKYYAFIRCDGVDYFVHVRNLLNSQDWEFMAEGALCAFEPQTTERGARARKLRVLV